MLSTNLPQHIEPYSRQWQRAAVRSTLETQEFVAAGEDLQMAETQVARAGNLSEAII